MVETTLRNKEEFVRRKKGIRSEADVTAQQLVNIYRQLSVLGEEATQRYNQQLISQINSEVLSSLRTIPGGEEVRDYYDFLTNTDVKEDDSISLDLQADALNNALPKPEQLSPLWATYGMQGAMPSVSLPVETPVKETAEPQNVQPSVPSPFDREAEINKISQVLSDHLDKQKESFAQIFESVVVDSDIERMHANLKNAADELMRLLDAQKENLLSVLDNLKKGENATDDASKDMEIRKQLPSALYKNFYKKSERKFSVDMTDEE